VAANVVTRREFEARDYAPIADVLREIRAVQIVDSGRRGALTAG
jgi:outer membrane receptor for ferrienterochelin and colicin